MKPVYKKLILWIALVLHISLIFSFSMQNSEQSTVISSGITQKVKTQEKFEQEIIKEKNESGTGKYITKNRLEVMAERRFAELEGFIRKLAHITLFFILGLLISFLISAYGMSRLFCALTSIVFAAAVGFADETIQMFSVGRAGLVRDVFVDVLGAVVASTFFFAGGIIYEKIKEKRLKMDS